VQSTQAIQRGAGLGIALIAGGLLLSAWTPLPFVLGAAVLGLVTLTLRPVLRLQHDGRAEDDAEESEISTRDLFLHNRPMQIFAGANMLWEFSFAGLKTFIVLYVVHGLHRARADASAVMAIVAVAYIVGAPIASRLADRYGLVPVMAGAAAAYGVSLCAGVIPTTADPMLVLLPVGAFAGAILMTLPQALAFTLAPDASQGAAAGLVDFSRGVGVVFGPSAVGAAVSLFSNVLPATSGYAVMWPVIGLPVLLSLVLLRRLRGASVVVPTPA
jgi:MFS family permease